LRRVAFMGLVELVLLLGMRMGIWVSSGGVGEELGVYDAVVVLAGVVVAPLIHCGEGELRGWRAGGRKKRAR